MSAFVDHDLPQLLFFSFCALAVLSSLGVVVMKSPVSAAFCLILVFLNIAGIFAMQEAFFLAVVQVLVYAGAIMVLFIFVIMLLSIEKVEADFPSKRAYWPVPIGLGLLFFVCMVFMLGRGVAPALGPYASAVVESLGGNVRVVSELMFSDYVLPFLTMGVLLSIAIVGAMVLAKRRVD